MSDLSSIFKNGGPNYSFGRVFTGLVLGVGMFIVLYAAVTDVTPYQISMFDGKSSYIVTEFKHKVDGANIQSLFIGISTLAAAVYGMSKLGAAVQTYAENSGSNSGTTTTSSSISSVDTTTRKPD